MDCSERKDQFLLYALGELDRQETREMRAHLAGGCFVCEGHLAEAEALLSVIPLSLPTQSPPAGAKSRLLERVVGTAGEEVAPLRLPQGSVRRKSQSPHWFKPAICGALAASVLVGLFFWQSLTEEKRKLRLAEDTIERQLGDIGDFKARQKLTVDELMMVASPKMQLVNLGGASQSGAKGIVCWDPASHHYFFCAKGLRNLQPGNTYELWLVDSINQMKKPVPAGVFQVDENGQAIIPINTARLPDTSNLIASAVTIEPGKGGDSPKASSFEIMGKL